MHEAQTVAHHATGLNWVDITVILMMLVSGIFAMMRGFVKEGFVLLSLVCGAVVAQRYFPVLAPWMHTQFKSKTTADICTWLGLFIGTLILFIPISSFVVSKVQGQAMTTIDRSLGFVFGGIRGLIIACLIFLLLTQFWDKPKDEPDWIKEARTRPLLQAGADLIKELVPIQKNKKDGEEADDANGDDAASTDDNDPEARRQSKIKKAEDMLRSLTRPEPELNKDQPSYDEKARKSLDQLIEKKAEP